MADSDRTVEPGGDGPEGTKVAGDPGMRWAMRFAWVTAGVGWFFWFAYEDRGFVAVLLVAAAFAAALGLTVQSRLWAGWRRRRRAAVAWTALVGLGSGASVSLLAVLLMLVKVSLHDHPVPDFTLADLRAVLGRTPVWALGGTMIGASLGVLFGGDRKGDRTA